MLGACILCWSTAYDFFSFHIVIFLKFSVLQINIEEILHYQVLQAIAGREMI